MTYKLEFLPSALKEWKKLGHTVREQIKKSFGSAWRRPRCRPMPFGICQVTSRSSYVHPVIAWFIESRMSEWSSWW